MSDKPNIVRAILLDPFAAAEYEKENLREIADWMRLTDEGLPNEEAWAEARELRTRREIAKQGGLA